MNTNLATFPQWNPYADEQEKRAYLERIFQWKDAFEEELRERHKHMKAGKSMALYLFIKEILGETAK